MPWAAQRQREEDSDMSFAVNDGARLYWRESGSGDPLLLIMGLGYSSGMWHHIESDLAEHFRVIVFDNRGIGRSEAPPGPIPITEMAEDAVAVLDAAGVESAFVFGLSMGGIIAQELALQYPRRVRALILGATVCGGSHVVQAKPEVREALTSRARLPVEQGIRVMFPYIYDVSTPAARIEADVVVRRADFPDPDVYLRQLEGIRQWQSCDRLHDMVSPTLILHGEHDELVPPANAHLLAQHIKPSRLCMIPNASHVFTTDTPDRTVQLIVEFLHGPSESERAQPGESLGTGEKGR
jgi:3-oxoadipate enol-lactonase